LTQHYSTKNAIPPIAKPEKKIETRIASIKLFRIHRRFFAFIPRTACAPGSLRTKSLETVATRVVTSTSHWIALFCERYWLAGVGGRGFGRRVSSFGENTTCELGARTERAASSSLGGTVSDTTTVSCLSRVRAVWGTTGIP